MEVWLSGFYCCDADILRVREAEAGEASRRKGSRGGHPVLLPVMGAWPDSVMRYSSL